MHRSRGFLALAGFAVVLTWLTVICGCSRTQQPARETFSMTASASKTATSLSNPSVSSSGQPSVIASAALAETAATSLPKGKVQPPATGAYTGIFKPPAPFDVTAVDTYYSMTGKRPAMVMWYQPWATAGMHAFDAAACVSLYRRGVIPIITWEPWEPGKKAHSLSRPYDQPDYRLSNIADGKYDDYIRGWAQRIRALGGPIMLRPLHEMNGTWYPWGGTVNGNSPASFIAAWRHIHDIFAEEHVTNVTWIWSVNRESVPATPDHDAFYPGDDYVDWIGVSGFNFGGSRWASFSKQYDTVLGQLKVHSKPIMLAEMASVEKGGDKAAWITDAYKRIQEEHPEVKAVIYYDNPEYDPKGKQDWNIDSSPGSEHAFTAAIASPYYLAGPASTLGAWLNGLTTDDWRRLRGFRPVY